MPLSRDIFDDLANSSASMLVVMVGSLKLYSKILKLLPGAFKIVLCVGLRHEPIKDVVCIPKRRAFATLSKFYPGTETEMKHLEHRIHHNFGVPIPFCLDNKATTVRISMFLVLNDRSLVPVCRSMIRLSSTRDPTTAMKWFPLVKYNGFTGASLEGEVEDYDIVDLPNGKKFMGKHYIVGSIQILTRRILQDRIGYPDLNDVLSFSVVTNDKKSHLSLAEQYDDSSSEYSFSDKDLSCSEFDEEKDNLFNGKYSSKIKGCYLESTIESLENQIPFPFIRFKDILPKFPTLQSIFHLMPLYNQKINKQILILLKRNKSAKVVLLGDDFGSKYRSGVSTPIKIPSSIENIVNTSLDWHTWFCKSVDSAIMQSVEAYSKSSLYPSTGKYKAGKYDMNNKSKSNFIGNKIATYHFEFLMKAMESNMDVLLVNTLFSATATEFARDIIDDLIFRGKNQRQKFTPYKNLFVIWDYNIKRSYQELGMDYGKETAQGEGVDESTLENKVGEEIVEIVDASDLSDGESHNIKIQEQKFCKLENDFDEFSEIVAFDERAMKEGIEKETTKNYSELRESVPLYNSLKRRVVDSIERAPIEPLSDDHPFSSLRLFKNDRVFIHFKTVGRGLLGILVLGDDETSPEDAAKIYTREISAHMAINEAIIRTKIKKAIRIYNSIAKGKLPPKKYIKISKSTIGTTCGLETTTKRTLSDFEIADILLSGITHYVNSGADIFHPSVNLTTVSPSLITCVDYSGFRIVVRPLPPLPFTICDWPLPIQSNERAEISNIEKCLNISNILHPTKLISEVRHLPILLETSVGTYKYYNFHHTYNVFPRDPWISDVKGERVNWGNSSTDEYYHNYNRSLKKKHLNRNKSCTIRPLFIKQAGAVQEMLKYQNEGEKMRRFHYVPDDLLELWKKGLEPSGFCLICSSDIQLRTFGFYNMDKKIAQFTNVTMKTISQFTETTAKCLIKINDGTHCSLCGKSIRIENSTLNNKVSKLFTYIGDKIPYPTIGNYDDGAALRMNRVKLLTSYIQSTTDYYSEWNFSEGDIFRRDEIFWERKPGLYCLPRSCIKGGGNLLGTGLDTIKYLLSQAKLTLNTFDDNIKLNKISDFNREDKLKIVKGVDVFDEPKRQNTVKIFFDELNVGQEIIFLSNSLHTNWIEIVLNQLESIPPFAPYDSVTLENFIHSRGLNCNLLGRMLNYTRSPWLKQLFSLEIVSRTIKNFIPKLIKTLVLPGAITYFKKEPGNLGRYCPCHTSSPSISMLHTIFRIHITSIKRRLEKNSGVLSNVNIDSKSKWFSSQFMNTDIIADEEKTIQRGDATFEKISTTNTTSLSIQSPIYWNEVFKSLNEGDWEILETYGINVGDISEQLINWAGQFFDITDNILNSETKKERKKKSKGNNPGLKESKHSKRHYSEEVLKMNKVSIPFWVLECLFSLNQKSLMDLKRYRFHQITIMQVMLTNLFNLILGDSPNSQLFWSTCISKLCSWEFSISENSISKNKIPIGALFTSLQGHTGIKFFLDIKKLKENLSDDPSFPIKYDDFNSILPRSKRKTEQYFSESLPIWGILETPEIIKLPRFNNFSVISTPTVSQKLIALSIKLSASYFTNVQFLFDFMTHSNEFQGAERHLIRQDWVVQESWLELLGYFSFLESDKKCITLLEKVINLFPQDHIASVQMRLLEMCSYSRLRNIEIFNDSQMNGLNGNSDKVKISENSIPFEISVSTLIFEIIDLHWSVIHPMIIDVYTSTALIHFIRGNWKSCEEILEKAISKSLVISSTFDTQNDVIRHFNKVISGKNNSNWKFENSILDSRNSLKDRILMSNIKFLASFKESSDSMIGKINPKNQEGENGEYLEDQLYQFFYDSHLNYTPKLLDTIENPNPSKIPKTPPKLRIGWLLKQLGKVRLIHALHIFYYNKQIGKNSKIQNNSSFDSGYSENPIGKDEISSLALLDDSIETILELSCFATQWALDIFDYYLGATTLETASCCFELAYGLIMLNEVVNDQRSQVLLKRSCELLIASFDVNSSLLLPFHHHCIDNLIQLALVYEKENLPYYSLKIWEIILEQLSVKSRTFDDSDYRIKCEFSFVGWSTPNKYFNIPLNFKDNKIQGFITNQNQLIIQEYISINNDEKELNNKEDKEVDRNNSLETKIHTKDVTSGTNNTNDKQELEKSKSMSYNTIDSTLRKINQREIIISAKNMIKESSQWNLRNIIQLLFQTKERLFYLFMNVTNSNQYQKRLFRLFLLASYLKRGDKLVNLKDWEPVLSLNRNSSLVDLSRLGKKGKNNNTSGLLFSVIYEANSWLYETEETNLAVSTFIEDHPTKIMRDKLFSGDGFSGPLSVLYNKRISVNNILLGSNVNEVGESHWSRDSYSGVNHFAKEKDNLKFGSGVGGGFGVGTGVGACSNYKILENGNFDTGKVIDDSFEEEINRKCLKETDFFMSGITKIGPEGKVGRGGNAIKDYDGIFNYSNMEEYRYNFEVGNERERSSLQINLDETGSRSNPRHLVSQIKNSGESMTTVESFFLDLITEAEDDIKAIWKNIKEQVRASRNSKKSEIEKIRLLNSKAQYEQRISRLSKGKICEILNDEDSGKINYLDTDIERNTLVKSINESEELTNIAEECASTSFPIYKGTLIATEIESKNLLSKLMVYNSRKASFGDEFEQVGSDSSIIYNAVLKDVTIWESNKKENGNKKIEGMRVNLENAFFTENTMEDADSYTKSYPLSYRSRALDILISLVFNVTDYRDYFSNWKERKE
ncbi:translation initiation factor eIF3 subunit 135 [Cryptosporidium felis]|nr:translation initiation factor eIF3 subunit 135 [Cryptosporidium felis]